MNERNTIRAGFFLVIVAGLVMGATILANADEVTVALKWLPQAQFAGYYVAKEMGFYEDEGLRVTIVPDGSGEQPE